MLQEAAYEFVAGDIACATLRCATEFEFGSLEDSTADQAGCSVERLCKVCGCSLIPHSMTPKPSWASIMNSKHRPSWYQRH